MLFPTQGHSALCPAPGANECLCPSLVDLLSGMQRRQSCCPGAQLQQQQQQMVKVREGESMGDVWRAEILLLEFPLLSVWHCLLVIFPRQTPGSLSSNLSKLPLITQSPFPQPVDH